MKKIVTILLFFIVAINLWAQPVVVSSYFNSGESCKTDQRHQFLYANDPVYKASFDKAQNSVREIVNSGVRVGGVYTIPVVVHVIHLGSPVGTNENISDAQIQSAIDNLNDAYSNTGYNGLDIEIQFALAQRDPDCNATTGIVRVNGSGVIGGGDNYSTVGITDNNETTIKALSNWSNSDYYNIWIVTEIDNNGGGSGTQGYAYFPGAANGTDGAVILYNAFGYDPTGALGYELKSYTNYNVTTIHELGHGLDLYHTFQGDGTGSTCPTNSNCATDGDECCDTDPHRRNDGTDCEAPVPNTCAGVSNSVVYNNFMAYSSDYCQERFTSEQKTRMRAAMEGPRVSLLTSLALTAPPGQAPNTAANTCSPVSSSQPSQGINGGYGGIMSVTFGDRTSTSSNTQGDHITYGTFGYMDYSQDCLKYEEFTDGDIIPISVTTWFNNHVVKVYVDWNDDGDFHNTNELAATLNITGSANSGNDMASGNITMPGTVTTDEFLRIRFIADISSPTDDCDGPTYGQVEDYAIYIHPSGPAAPVANFSANATTVCQNATVTFTDASTDATTYSWNFGSGASPATATGVGPHNVTYSTTGNKTVTLDVTGPGGNDNETKTNYITVNSTVTPSVSISSNDADNSICSGTSVTFTASPTNGGTPSYQWKLNGGNVGSNSSTYLNAALADNDQVSCVMTSTASCASPTTATSNTITMDVISSVTPSVSISSDDADNSICAGTSVTFTAVPTNGGASPSYQWKRNGNNVGTNSTTYVNAALADNDQISCVMTSNATCASPSTGTSNTITMDVITNVTPSVSISSNDADNTICSGTNVTFTATPTNGGASPSYQWKLNGNNVGTNSANYSNSTLADNDQVSCVMTSNASCTTVQTATSNTITTTVVSTLTPSVSIVSNDADNSICSGTNVTFTATPVNGGVSPSYQWKLNGNNVGTNSANYSNSTLADNDQVSCVMTSNDPCASPATATSNTITMDVITSVTPSVSISASANPINSGDPVTFTATPANGGTPSYQWNLNGGNVGTNSPTYNNSTLSNGDQISCVMTSTATCASPTTANSNVITMTVNSPGSCTNDASGPAGVGNSTTNRIWLDASSLNLTNGAYVPQWNDQSGNGLSATPTYTSSRPIFRTNQLNGFPALDFDGTGDHLRIPNVPGINNQPISWFVVGNFNQTATSQAMLHFAHSGTSNHKNLRFTICYNNGSINRINSSNLNSAGGGVPSNFTLNTNSQIFTTVIGTSTINTFSNGTATGSNSGTFLSPANNNLYVTIGQRAYLNDMFLDGNVSEVIVFNYQLNVTERTLVENYLSSKYNLSISNDKYAYESTGHYYEVTGIGMESGVSVAEAEGGSGVKINTPSSLANGDYLMWGHNNAALSPTTSGTPTAYGGTGEMLTRVWRADKTNDVGTVTVNFYLEGITTGGSTDFELLKDADGNFANATRITSGFTYDSDCEMATWTGVNFSDGDYFTIGNPDGAALLPMQITEIAQLENGNQEDENSNEGALEIYDNYTESVQMKLYPNPTSGLLYIENAIEGATIEIYNSLGQVIFHNPINNGKNQFDFSHFNAGLYIVHLKDINHETIAITQLMISK